MASYNPNEFSIPAGGPSPSGGGGGGAPAYNANIEQIGAGDDAMASAPNPHAPSHVTDEMTMAEIMSGVFEAARTGATQLPSRDIPMNTDAYVYQNTEPNHIPEPEHGSYPPQYIEQYDARHDLASAYRYKQQQEMASDWFDRLRIPILLAILYFAFQLPFLKQLIGQYIPSLISTNTGMYTLYGNIFVSTLFGAVYYALTTFIEVVSLF